MSYIRAREAIRTIMNSSRSCDRKKFMVNQILWAVATYECPEDANSLIHEFDLYMWDQGAHEWFDAENAPDHRPLCGPDYVKIEREFHSKPGKKISSKGVK